MKSRQVRWGELDLGILEPEDPQAAALNVVFCHGYGAPGDDLVPLASMIGRFDARLPERVRFLFPQAPIDLTDLGLPGGRAWWNLDLARLQAAIATGTFGDLTKRTPAGLPASRERLTQLLEDSARETGIPVSRTVLGGFSQGAMLSTDVALHLPTPPAGLIILSGSLINRDDWSVRLPTRSGIPVLQSHGRYDPLLPFEVAALLRDELTAAGNPVEFYEFPGGHEIPFEVMKLTAEFLGKRMQGAG